MFLPVPAALLRPTRALLLAGAASLALSACATNVASTNHPSIAQPDYTGMTRTEAEDTLSKLADAYKHRPKDKRVIINYAAALRAAGQPDQAAAVLEAGLSTYKTDGEIRIAYAKALTASGRFDQALSVLDDAIDPAAPNWNALSIKGAVLDQMGRNAEARQLYNQALLKAPNEASLEANLGLSYAMTNELSTAEQHLRKATRMAGASSRIRQNLALVIGLQGRFEEARKLYSAELTSDQVEANMAYIRALLTQQNRWDAIAADKG
jgi:Flp pilus assembly protein TadD